MAKAAVKSPAKSEEKTQLTVVPPAGGPPAHLADRLAKSEGRGVSTARDDNVIPLLYVLQKSSPQTDDRSDAYVKGAKAGELWVRGTERIISGVDGVEVQPCAFIKCWIEWGAKRGDGFKGRHPDRPDEAAEKEVLNEEGKPEIRWVMPSGNIVVETREHYVLMGNDAIVISMTGSQHTVSRTWMALMNQFRDERTGKPIDSFARKYHISTVRREKDGNSWYVIKAVDAGWVDSAEQYDRGLALYQAVMSGEKVADAPEGEPGAASEGTMGGEEADRRAAESGI